MQIANNSNQLIGRGAGGRGEALKSAPTPKGVTGRVEGFPDKSL